MPELILFGIVALLIFGPKKLPEMGRSLGKGLREFKDSVSSDKPDVVEGTASPVVDQMRAADAPADPFADAVPSTNGATTVAR